MREAVFRYFLAGVVTGAGRAIGYGEVGWVARTRLREHDFGSTAQQVVEWYTECPGV